MDCHVNCTKCNGINACIECKLNYYLSNGNCVDVCPTYQCFLIYIINNIYYFINKFILTT